MGIAAELPSGQHSSTNLSFEEFHDFLLDKKDSYVKTPAERVNIDACAVPLVHLPAPLTCDVDGMAADSARQMQTEAPS